MSEAATNHLSIYLIKSEFSEWEDVLKDADDPALRKQEVNDKSIFYYEESRSSKPKWLANFFNEALPIESGIYSAFSKALLIIKVEVAGEERIFCIAFGLGRHLIKPWALEERFGLKVTLNTVDPDNLRRIDKTNITSVPKQASEQISRLSAASDFGIDIEQDLITGLAGKSKDDRFGKTIAGKDVLGVSVKVNFDNIDEFLKLCFEKYQSEDYKEYFHWIDQIAETNDPELIASLNNKLIEAIKENIFEKLWMAVPEMVEWPDVEGFKYGNKKKDNYREDIDVVAFLEKLSEEEATNLTVEILRAKQVNCFSSSSGQIKYHWSAFNCIYCEVEHEGKTYLLNNGKWYQIDKDFVQAVNREYQEFINREPVVTLPKYHHKNEAEYNIAVSGDENFCLMDRKNISYGGGPSRIEFCDLLTKDNDIIHVKRYGGSSVLSHLFWQGVVSGELFLAEEDFRKKVNEKLDESHKLANPEEKPQASEYKVIFAIISKSEKTLELPFFSKVSLRNTLRRLERALGYPVTLQKIDYESTQD